MRVAWGGLGGWCWVGVWGVGWGRKCWVWKEGLDRGFKIVVVAAACRQKGLLLLCSIVVGVGVEKVEARKML